MPDEAPLSPDAAGLESRLDEESDEEPPEESDEEPPEESDEDDPPESDVEPAEEPFDDPPEALLAAFVLDAPPRSFFAHPEPLKWIAGDENCFRIVPSRPHDGQNLGPSS